MGVRPSRPWKSTSGRAFFLSPRYPTRVLVRARSPMRARTPVRDGNRPRHRSAPRAWSALGRRPKRPSCKAVTHLWRLSPVPDRARSSPSVGITPSRWRSHPAVLGRQLEARARACPARTAPVPLDLPTATQRRLGKPCSSASNGRPARPANSRLAPPRTTVPLDLPTTVPLDLPTTVPLDLPTTVPLRLGQPSRSTSDNRPARPRTTVPLDPEQPSRPWRPCPSTSTDRA